jgi:N-hydroxyarylamine O-acetyltransferase
MANWFTSTHPQSAFVRTLTVQRSLPDVRYILRYPSFSEIRSSGVETRQIGRGELIPLLRDVFGIDLPSETIFPAIDGTSQPALT